MIRLEPSRGVAQALAIESLERVRWPEGPVCPYCNARGRSTAMPSEGRYHCNSCFTSFSVTTGTPLHRTHIPIEKWFQATQLLLNPNEDPTIRQLAATLVIDKNTAWQLKRKILAALRRSDERRLLLESARLFESPIEGS